MNFVQSVVFSNDVVANAETAINKECLFYQNGARIVDSVLQGKMVSTLTQGSWIDMGNFKGIHLVKVLFQAF